MAVIGEYWGPVYNNNNPNFSFEEFICLPFPIVPIEGMAIVAVPKHMASAVQLALANVGQYSASSRAPSRSSLALPSSQVKVPVARPRRFSTSEASTRSNSPFVCLNRPPLPPAHKKKYSIIQNPNKSSLIIKRNSNASEQ